MPETMPRETLMTTREAAVFLRINPLTLQSLVRRKLLPAMRVGRQLRFKREDLENHLRSAQGELKAA